MNDRETSENERKNQRAADPENVLHPEEVDPLEVLDTLEESLRRVVRGARGKVLRKVDPAKPTWVEVQAGERPVTAASLAMASGFVVGLAVRRVMPWRIFR